MDTPAGSGQRSAGTRGKPDRRPEVLGSLTIPGSPRHVASARAFITRTLSRRPGVDSDAATLLTSELVTNAIQHTRSGHGGAVWVVVIGLPDGVLVEVTDQGATGAPVVKGELYAADGHGLYLVQQLAGRWGFLRDPAGTTVWFHLPAGTGGQGVSRQGASGKGGGGPGGQRARAAARTAAQIRARSSSPVT
jgi:anti-sigma regulatory factor (Ser/Thr protein kinase)